jgi:serine/threonine-protein kinase
MDPAIERVILRCLEKDPDKRPMSAITVAASLPGSDALAQALADGETPSPELLLAAGEREAMPVRRALLLALATVVLLFGALGPIASGSVAGVASMPIARDALADRAEQIIQRLGFAEPVADRRHGFSIDRDYLRWAERTGGADWWAEVRNGRPSPITFWYRTSPAQLEPVDAFNGRVEADDPPMTTAGMRKISLDARGRVVEFRSVPPETIPAGQASQAAVAIPAWDTLFAAAELDRSTFTATTPRWLPRDFSDATGAWEGPMPGRPTQRVRVEAAALAGRVTWFRVIWPWTEPQYAQDTPETAAQKIATLVGMSVWISLLVGGVALARRNFRLRRADTRGAARFGIVMLLATLIQRLAVATHTSDPGTELGHLATGLMSASFTGGYCWVYYLAIEPYGRRFWPDALLGWTRLWSGRIRDPRVGGELLIGLAFGALSLVVLEVPKRLSILVGWKLPQFPFGNSLWVVAGTPELASQWLNYVMGGLQSALGIAMIFLVLRLLIRRPRVALVAGVVSLLFAMNNGQILIGDWIGRFNVVSFTALMTLVIHRYGLIAGATVLFVDNLISDMPLTTDLGAWWSAPTVLTLSLVLGLVGFAYYSARAGEPLFGNVVGD